MAAPTTRTPSSSSSPCRLLDLITVFDNLPLDFEQKHDPYYRLILAPDARAHGYIHPNTIARMPWPAALSVDHERRLAVVSAPPAGTSLSAHAGAAFQEAVDAAIDGGVFPTLGGMHSEHFLVPGARGPVRIERFAAPLFGIGTRGAHLTAYTTAADGRLGIWVARRSRSLHTYPGMLDSTVAGGVKAGDSPLDCILAESMEEASLPPSLVRSRARATGVITMANRNPRSELVHSEILYTYDLELSGEGDEVPRLGDDGEVEEFVLMGCQEVERRMLAGEFKTNVCAVMIDFLVRHGRITPEGEPDYVEICARLRRRLPVPTRSDV
ncbi:thiamine pyrophosphokinase [Trichoderma cornu-damae]|uniref:Thiamine pyrophosphokinase n=1 Tax=Trichoderma cornu-damae TaxID=654480 RepID=A0A9P8QFW3_9HYPO|nr:thiamine pyrophosphokinase [Trichoderma cornu-damae]